VVSAEFAPDSKNGFVLIRPHRSLSWRENMIFLGLIGAIYLITSILLTMQGFWPVIPWAIVDLALIYGCLYALARGAGRREVIRLDDSEVRVERGRIRPEHALSAPRQQVYCLVRSNLRAGSRMINVFLRLGLKTTEIGADLGPFERDQLVAALKRVLPVHEYAPVNAN